MNRDFGIILPFLIAIFQEVSVELKPCDSPQYLVIGKAGTIHCSFNNTFGILWYTSTDFENGTPTLQYDVVSKTGPGYDSGEFDIHPNGSLIINEVHMRHDDTFRVAHSESKKDFYELNKVRVNVVVKPEIPFPSIDSCGKDSIHCFKEIDEAFVRCLVRGVRPSILLDFLSRTVEGDKNITKNLTITSEDSVFTSTAATNDVFHYSPRLALVVCKATGLTWTLASNESTILMLQKGVVFSKEEAKSITVMQQKRLELTCKKAGFIVWKKASLYNYMEQYLLLYSVFIADKYWEIFVDDVVLENNTTLVITSIDVKHEGMYFCIYGDGLMDRLILYEVKVTVPAYPLIEGCNWEQYCVLEVEQEGNLTCTAKGVRPQVKLRWRAYYDDTSFVIVKDELIVTKKETTFDVILVSQYRVSDKTRDKLTVECGVLTTEKTLLGLTMAADLHFVKGHVTTVNSPPIWLPWIIASVIAACLVVVICGIIIKIYKDKRECVNTKEENFELQEGELESMILDDRAAGNKNAEKKQQFVKQLKEKYKNLCSAVKPIPFIKDRLRCVDRLFVESGIEYLDSSVKGQETSLKSYQNMFDGTKIQSTRLILEGEPGYGKTTITLQLAYDWCNATECSPMRHVDILILLRLRQLGGVTSIFTAIKQFLLREDSQLSQSDIENILQERGSVLVILDGFDEFPYQNSTTSDVFSIIAGQMFQEFGVIVTTRSFCLPNQYPPFTQRLRLTGFDENARRYYIRKAVVGDDSETVRKVEEYLEENPILNDLCQVPLLFVIFAHMTFEREKFRKLTSVTRFFRYMISCFHSHMKNKMDDDNVSKYKLFETEHDHLDELAFKGLSRKNQRIFWGKEEISQLLGREFYDQYVRIGILVEEEVIDFNDDPGTPIDDHVYHNTEVRFYHKLFCEWYAAHYLAKYINQNPNFDLTALLQHLDPSDVQYIYRFSCGLNSKSSEKIISYLKDKEGGDKFATLCILEQTGTMKNIMETIRHLCFEGVIISGHDSLLLQRSSIQLLEIAARNNISVRYICLHNCLKPVPPSTTNFTTDSGLTISSKMPFEILDISLYNREMTKEEYVTILKMSSVNPSLNMLVFFSSPPPRLFKVDETFTILRKKKVQILYRGVTEKSPKCLLNLKTGRWVKKDGRKCTKRDFEEMITSWREGKGKTDVSHKQEIKKVREKLKSNDVRELAEAL